MILQKFLILLFLLSLGKPAIRVTLSDLFSVGDKEDHQGTKNIMNGPKETKRGCGFFGLVPVGLVLFCFRFSLSPSFYPGFVLASHYFASLSPLPSPSPSFSWICFGFVLFGFALSLSPSLPLAPGFVLVFLCWLRTFRLFSLSFSLPHSLSLLDLCWFSCVVRGDCAVLYFCLIFARFFSLLDVLVYPKVRFGFCVPLRLGFVNA